VEARVEATIREEDLLHPGDRVAVGLSGGKDSTALLIILSRLLSEIHEAKLIAITIDEGIAGYRSDTIKAAEELTRRLGVEHRIISFHDMVGRDLDTILKGREPQACTVCGILRKKALMDTARACGATVIATGHNLDDEAQSVLMNALRGDLPRLIRNAGAGRQGLFLPRVKPLAAVTEKEIAAYLFVQGCFPALPECPYTRYALRAGVRGLLAGLEGRHPGTMTHLVGSKKKIEKYTAGAPVMEPLHRCRECGDPCSGELCQVCRLWRSLDL
jgi:uncharacterized protein (TIGR00269 family)